MTKYRIIRNPARNSDPDTSHQAAKELNDYHVKMLRKLLTVFAIKGAMTAEQACQVAGYTAEDGAWKRVSDLKTLGFIEDTKARDRGSSGRFQMVLQITPEGIRELGNR